KVELKGITPLLMNNPQSMIDEQTNQLKQKTSKQDLSKEAEKLTYKDTKGNLYVPSEAIKGCMINASAYKKIGKYSAKPIIAGGVHIQPREISLGTKKYSLDIRTVVIQRSRVVKARPMIENWKIIFDLQYDETLIPSSDIIKPILEEGGKRVGILDFRPQKTGSFGMFEITKWEEKD
ncbi:MAG: hypothetical protein ACOC1P_02880, partial [Minisyncoccales bacterium]